MRRLAGPPYDPVLMLQILVLQVLLSACLEARCSFLRLRRSGGVVSCRTQSPVIDVLKQGGRRKSRTPQALVVWSDLDRLQSAARRVSQQSRISPSPANDPKYEAHAAASENRG
jgi:hypothetical protein